MQLRKNGERTMFRLVRNASESPATDQRPTWGWEWMLTSVPIFLDWGLSIFGSTTSFGAHGFGFALYGVVASWILMSRIDSLLRWPINKIRPTLIECVVVFMICGVLHGLALPSVMTNCVGRRPTTPTMQPSSLQTPMNSLDPASSIDAGKP